MGTYVNWDAPKLKGNSVNIYYSMNNGVNWIEIKKGVKNSGMYIWKTPDKKTSKCLIKIENSSDPNDFDTSDRTFILR